MALFELAIGGVLKHEGGFSNDPKDKGGPTKYGVSLSYLKLSKQGDFDCDGDIDIDDIKEMSLNQAKDIYLKDWWNKHNYGLIDHQIVANKIFDLAVNMGAKQAHKIVQRAIWAVMGMRDYIKDDGILGPVTIHALNQLENKELIPAIRAEAAGFYRLINQPKYLRGWLNRAYA